jgi:Calcium-binding EGF domain
VNIIYENGDEDKLRVTTDQQIYYKECPLKVLTNYHPQEPLPQIALVFKVKQSQSIQNVRFKRISVHHGDQSNPAILRLASQAMSFGPEASAPVSSDTPATGQRQSAQPADACANNECNEPNMHCVPTHNSYKCECDSGFEVQQGDLEGTYACMGVIFSRSNRLRTVCKKQLSSDINECEYEDPCGGNGDCENMVGSYRCSCHDGYTLGRNNKCIGTR